MHLRLMKQDGTAFVAWFNEEDTERALFEALKTPVHAFLAACIMATVQGDWSREQQYSTIKKQSVNKLKPLEMTDIFLHFNFFL